ncbi:hypothetical protein FDF08_09735 [Micrococcus luteus]|nr:hypothetical protein FDF08_09735 [Micrococcus luteus]
MPSREQLEAFNRDQALLHDLVMGALDGMARRLGRFATPDQVLTALLEAMPELVGQFGHASATLAAEWLEEVYGIRAVLGETYPLEAVTQTLRRHAGQLWQGAGPEAVVAAMRDDVARWVKAAGRGTLRDSATANGLRWARVPSGPITCAFCLMLASRDAVYLTRNRALRTKSGEDRYHNDCDCIPTPIRGPQDYPTGYDPDELYSVYSEATSAVGSRANTTAILENIRRAHPGRVRDGVHTTN